MSTIGVDTTFDILRVVFSTVFLCYASYTDLKERRVKDKVWMLMGLTGGIFLALQMFLEEKTWEYFLIFIPIAMLFISMFMDWGPLIDKEKKYINLKLLVFIILAVAVLIYLLLTLWGNTYFHQLLTIPVLIILFYMFYQFNILHGGADAKALMTLAIFVPFYPEFLGFPMIELGPERISSAMELFFPFAFLVLMNAVIVVVWIFLAFIVYNTVKGDIRVPEMLLGYTMDLDLVEKKFVWPMERVEDGKRVRILFPKSGKEPSLDDFRKMGTERIWVTPKIPFIVALTGGFLLSVIVGNIFMAVMGILA